MTPLERARLWLDKVPPAISGAGGHDHTITTASGLVQGFLLSDSDALGLLSSWNLRCSPPWSDTELEHKIEDAKKFSPSKGMGWKLKEREFRVITKNSVEPKYSNEINPKKAPSTWSPKESKLDTIAQHGADIIRGLEECSLEELINSSPANLPESPNENFQAYLQNWNDTTSPIWIGNVKDSGRPECGVFFKEVGAWRKAGVPHPQALWTSGCSFIEGSYSRSKETIHEHRYSIIESDRWSHAKQVAIFNYLISELKLNIPMIVNTMGTSLHGWLDRRGLSATFLSNLELLLCGIHNGLEEIIDDRGEATGKQRRKFLGGMGCDPATFRGSQPARLPGAIRPFNPSQPHKLGGLQHIVYFNPTTK